MSGAKEKDQELKIDESTHKRVPNFSERLVHSLVSAGLGFVLYHIIGFWVFPGLGWYAMKPFKGYFGLGSVIEVIDVIGLTVVILCAVLGWFRGKYFVDRLAGYFDFWKFW